MATEPMKRIIARLRKGADWLRLEYDALMEMPDLGLGSKREAQFLEALDLWDNLDQVSRTVYGFKSCPMVGVCRKDAPVVCRACGTAAGDRKGGA